MSDKNPATLPPVTHLMLTRKATSNFKAYRFMLPVVAMGEVTPLEHGARVYTTLPLPNGATKAFDVLESVEEIADMIGEGVADTVTVI